MNRLQQFALLLFVLYCTKINAESLSVCLSKPGDVLLYEQRVQVTGVVFQQRTESVSYPNNGENVVINCLRVIDQWTDGTGGKAKITEGGIEANYLAVDITTKMHRGMDFIVQFLGKRK